MVGETLLTTFSGHKGSVKSVCVKKNEPSESNGLSMIYSHNESTASADGAITLKYTTLISGIIVAKNVQSP